MKKIVIRALSGAVYVGLIVASILCANGKFFPLLCSLFALLAVIEFDRLASHGALRSACVRALDIILCVMPSLTIAFSSLAPSQYIYTGTFFAAGFYAAILMVRVVFTLYSREGAPVRSLAYSFLAIAYIAIPLFMASMLADSSTRYVLLLVFVLIWINDTGAYLTGTAFGRHRLCERLSPKKSWEGFVGGLLFSAAAGIAGAVMFSVDLYSLTPLGGAILGVVVSVLATWGDLFESLLKRTAEVKDSGHIMPGHGGILDRIDSFLFVAPVVALFLFFV